MDRERIKRVVEQIKEAIRYDESISEPRSTTASVAEREALPLLEEMLDHAGENAGAERDALLLHLKQSGFVCHDDGTVAIFTGSFAVGDDSVSPVAWTSAERLVDTILARFELRDRQAAEHPSEPT